MLTVSIPLDEMRAKNAVVGHETTRQRASGHCGLECRLAPSGRDRDYGRGPAHSSRWLAVVGFPLRKLKLPFVLTSQKNGRRSGVCKGTPVYSP